MRCQVKALVLTLLLFGVTISTGGAADPLSIYTVNYPLQYFANRIADEHASTVFPAPRGVDPAFWIPSVEDIARYQSADLILLNGAGYARWLDRASLHRSKMVNTSSAFRNQFLTVQQEPTHSHGRAGTHSHAGTAFTTWLDFRQAVLQAGAIAAAMIGRRAEMKDKFASGLQKLELDLLALDATLVEIIAGRHDVPLIASHPIYQYLARRYQLNLKSVQWEPEVFPAADQWAELENILAEHEARWMIWESQPMQETVQRLTELGVASLVFDPGANTPGSGDWLDLMRSNLENLRPAFK